MFSAIFLGAVLAFAIYKIFHITAFEAIFAYAIFYAIFSFYALITNLKNGVYKVFLFKEHLSVTVFKQNGISCIQNVAYDDIKSYKISPLVIDKTPLFCKVKSKFRNFGYTTKIETKNDEVIEFSNSKKDGILMYSPNYVYRMLDLKRLIPDFPLELVGFDSDADIEGFNYQFDFYLENGENLPLHKNKVYLKNIFKYSFKFSLCAMILALILSSLLYLILSAKTTAILLFIFTLKASVALIILALVTILMICYSEAFYNKNVSKAIKDVVNG